MAERGFDRDKILSINMLKGENRKASNKTQEEHNADLMEENPWDCGDHSDERCTPFIRRNEF